MNRRNRRRGFATIVALFGVGLVAAALAVVTAGAVADARRTRGVVVTAQLRQLLLAGGIDAAARAATWGAEVPAGTRPLATPADYTVSERDEQTGADSARVTVTAVGENHRASQEVTFTRRGGQWRPTAATLGG